MNWVIICLIQQHKQGIDMINSEKIKNAAIKHSEKYMDDPHGLAEESFIAGVIFTLETLSSGELYSIIKGSDLYLIEKNYSEFLSREHI